LRESGKEQGQGMWKLHQMPQKMKTTVPIDAIEIPVRNPASRTDVTILSFPRCRFQQLR
jgi:hypothetical protein